MVPFPHLKDFSAEIWAALDKYGVHVPNGENRSSQVSIFFVFM